MTTLVLWRIRLRLACILLASFTVLPVGEAQAQATVYARQRAATPDGGVYRGGYRPPVRPPFNQGNTYQGNLNQVGFGFYPYQPAIAGSWYTRPYPHHLDYFRLRNATPQQAYDCPYAARSVSE